MPDTIEPIIFLLNRGTVEEKVAPGVVLLDIIRRTRHLTGTKEACVKANRRS